MRAEDVARVYKIDNEWMRETHEKIQHDLESAHITELGELLGMILIRIERLERAYYD